MANSPKKGKPTLRVISAPSKKKNAPKFGPADNDYFKLLHSIVDKIFDEADKQFGWSWSQLAIHANLSYLTVTHLGDRETLYPRFQTVYKLATAVGWKLSLQETPVQSRKSTARVVAG